MRVPLLSNTSDAAVPFLARAPQRLWGPQLALFLAVATWTYLAGGTPVVRWTVEGMMVYFLGKDHCPNLEKVKGKELATRTGTGTKQPEWFRTRKINTSTRNWARILNFIRAFMSKYEPVLIEAAVVRAIFCQDNYAPGPIEAAIVLAIFCRAVIYHSVSALSLSISFSWDCFLLSTLQQARDSVNIPEPEALRAAAKEDKGILVDAAKKVMRARVADKIGSSVRASLFSSLRIF